MQKQLHILRTSALGLVVVCIIMIGSWNIFPTAMSRTLRPQEQAPAAELSAAIGSQRQTAAELTRSASFNQRFRKLSDEAQKKGSVRVIVKVRAPFQPEGKISSAALRMAQRSVIAEAQDRLLAGLSYAPSSLKKYEVVPYLALSTDSAGLAQLESSADVLDLGPDLVMRLAAGENLTQVGATNAWYWEYTGVGKTIAILDSGVDKTHQELSGKVVAEACYSTTDTTKQYSSVCPTSPEAGSGIPCTVGDPGDVENCGHGTHIAGIAAGRAGVAKEADIISIQVMTRSDNPDECGFGSCLRALNSDLIFALQHVNEIRGSYDVAAVNVGLVTDLTNSYPNACDGEEGVGAVKDLIDQLRSVGIAVVAPSGNDGMSDAIRYPACISTAVSVGAVGTGVGGTAADEVWGTSNGASFLKLLAPGVGITSAIPGGENHDRHDTAAGTSQAAAHVSGAMALLRQELPRGDNSTVWFDDALPAGAVPAPANTASGGVDEAWNWVSTNPTPHAGTLSHQSSIVTAANIRQHYFMNATTTLHIEVGEILYAWAYLDSGHMPSEIMLQWNDGESWDHRAYWGSNNIPWGEDGTPSRKNMGRLPQAGGWVKLVIPARAVGLEGKTVSGMAFSQYEGRVTWNQVGKGSASAEDLLTLLRSTGVWVTDTRITTPPPRIIPRIQIDKALGVTAPDDRWVVAYYNNMNLDEPSVFLGNDGNGFIDHTFSGVSPAPGIGTENYSIRWTRRLAFTQGRYKFSVTGDDGVRLYIDGKPEILQWGDQPATTYNVNVDLTADIHEIKLEYYQNTGPAQVRLIWGAYDPGCEQGVPDERWKGEYYNNMNLMGSPSMTLDNGNGFLSFDWVAGKPCPLQGQQCSACNIFADYFSARWTRSVDLAQGPYRFTVSGDDWVRLLIDDHLWFAGTGTQAIDVTINTSRKYKIVLEFTEVVGNASVSLSWVPTPAPPSNLVASAASTSQINLSWADNSGNEEGFKIERWNGSSYAEINTVGTNVTTYADSGLAPGTTYSYRVRAYNNVGASGYSNESSATTFACSYVISPTSAGFTYHGGSGSVTVSAPAGCSWSATSNVPWIGVTSGSSGIGNGTVTYGVGGFCVIGPARQRLGSLTVAGQTFGITQIQPPLSACF